MSDWRIPRESVELVGPITVTDDGTPVTDFDVAVLGQGFRPEDTDWATPDLVGSDQFVLVGPGTDRPLVPGVYRLWVRYTANPETPVLDAVASIRIT